MVINDTISNLYTQRLDDSVVKAVERINTGLKINDFADDSASYILSDNLKRDSSVLLKGIENANSGLGLIEVTNKAISYQEDLLNNIKDKLELAKISSTDDASRDLIRTDIQNLLNTFDKIASSTSYNNNYTLQRSSTDNQESLSISFTLNNTSVSSDSLRSNSEGVNLTSLKNLSAGELDYEQILTQLSNVDNAFTKLDEYKDSLKLTQIQLDISVQSLTSLEERTSLSQLDVSLADLTKEQAVVDKYQLLVESSEYAISQAHTTQKAVLDLLTSIPDYKPNDDDKNTYSVDDKEDDVYTYNNDNQSTSYEAPKTSTPSVSSESKE